MAKRKIGDVDWGNSLLHGVVFYIFAVIFFFLLEWVGIILMAPDRMFMMVVFASMFFFMGFISRAID